MDPTIMTFVLGALVAEKGGGVVCDLGTVSKGPDIVMEVVVENRTDEPVTIYGSEGTCVPAMVKMRVIEPGARTLLKPLRVETRNFSGPIGKSQTIQIEAKGTGDVYFECASCGTAGGGAAPAAQPEPHGGGRS